MQEQLASGALPRRHLPLLAWAFATAGLQQPAAWEALSSALQGGKLAGAVDRSGLTQLYQAHLAQAASPSPLYLPAAGLQAARAAYLGWASRASFSEAQVLQAVRCGERGCGRAMHWRLRHALAAAPCSGGRAGRRQQARCEAGRRALGPSQTACLAAHSESWATAAIPPT
jgi:hypothetical protein